MSLTRRKAIDATMLPRGSYSVQPDFEAPQRPLLIDQLIERLRDLAERRSHFMDEMRSDQDKLINELTYLAAHVIPMTQVPDMAPPTENWLRQNAGLVPTYHARLNAHAGRLLSLLREERGAYLRLTEVLKQSGSWRPEPTVSSGWVLAQSSSVVGPGRLRCGVCRAQATRMWVRYDGCVAPTCAAHGPEDQLPGPLRALCMTCRDTGEVAATAGHPEDGPAPCPECYPEEAAADASSN